ncbi:MAG TPA: hypothetical protein VKY74_13465 [Chloroflexia bacterium]|nr:hypothetical protein [Chloroflexia bacterium]
MTPRTPTNPPAGIEQTRFPAAPYDWQVRIISGLFALTLLWFGFQVGASLYLGELPHQTDLIFIVLVGGVMLWRWLNSVRAYIIETGGPDGPRLLIVDIAPWRKIPVPLARLRSVEGTPTIRAILNVSMFNMGSLFGWSGAANVPDVGSVLAYATNARRAILLELTPRATGSAATGDGPESRGPTLLLSPRDPAALAAALQPFCGRRPGALFTAAPPGPRSTTPAPRKKRR